MTIFKSIATVTATAAIALGATLAGTAPAAADDVHTIVSDTWQPGLFNDGDGKYIRHVTNGDGDGIHQVTRIEARDTWAPGFHSDGDGRYQRVVSSTQSTHGGATSIAQRDTWAPGFTLDDMTNYSRIVPNGAPAQTATMPDAAQ